MFCVESMMYIEILIRTLALIIQSNRSIKYYSHLKEDTQLPL